MWIGYLAEHGTSDGTLEYGNGPAGCIKYGVLTS
jgi:hypothetical protein